MDDTQVDAPEHQSDPREFITRLGLSPHPEGGWYRETWRADTESGGRAIATAILFLLEHGQRSRWHRVDAAEIWLWHAGHPLKLMIAAASDAPVTSTTLGPDVIGGATPQHVIAPDEWQAAHAEIGWALVSCVVSPGFEFEGFTMAPEGWEPGQPDPTG